MVKFLTDKEIKIKNNIGSYKRTIRRYQRKLVHNCKHTCIVLEKKEPDYVGLTINWGGASCAICNENFGWYCPKSPTNVCNYELEDGTINGDHCKHCDDPYERK
jgi:hypothetical protein